MVAVILVGGEALVDLVPGPGGTLLPRLGGGPFTVAVALGRLGAEVGLLARVSTDAFGAAQVRRLAEAGVHTGLVQRGGEPTALAVASVGADGSASYTFYLAGTAAAAFADPGPLPPAVLSLGSLGLVIEPAAAAYEAVLRREAAAGRLVALDPNVRPALIEDAGAWRERFEGWLPGVGLLKLSTEDAAWLAPGTRPPDAVARWLRRGPRAVVLTAGSGGLTVYTRSGPSVHVPAAPVVVADTIGAGDTVQAALLARLQGVADLDALPEPAWREVLDFAARAAAVTCSRSGADPPWAHEL